MLKLIEADRCTTQCVCGFSCCRYLHNTMLSRFPFLSQLNCFEKGAHEAWCFEAAKLLKVKKKSTTVSTPYNLSFLPLITPFTSLFERFWELPTRNSCTFNRNCDERRGVCNFRCFPPLFHVARNLRGDLVKESD